MTTPNRLGRVDSFRKLVANFYSLKTKKIPAGRQALGDRLGCYSVSTVHVPLPSLGSGSLLVMLRGFGQRTKGLN